MPERSPKTTNGFQDDDGCPDDVPTTTTTAIADVDDKCPDDAEDGDGFRGRGRLPTAARTPTATASPTQIDKCPDEPEDNDGFEDDDGCPDPDNDNDGILDVDDQCPNSPRTKNGFQDEDGCPDEVPDSDNDGIPDTVDKCPDSRGERTTASRTRTAARIAAALVELTGEEVKIKDIVNFAKDSDKIIGPRSFLVLDAVGGLLAHHPEIFQIEVGGHTDSTGDAAANTDLSKRRAAAVVDYLTTKGVEAKRLSSQGYGPDKPIADNKTAGGRGKNRRVEFRIVSSAKKSAAPPQ